MRVRCGLEPTVNRTSLLYDRLSYVLRRAKVVDRFSYTYYHPAFHRTIRTIEAMPVTVASLKSLCVDGYPTRGKKPDEESADGIPILKVRNVTGRGIDWDSEYGPDTDVTRAVCARALLKKGDILITSTGEGTIGRVELYLYDDPAIVDGHVTICRLKDGINLEYVAEFLRSEHGQIQMLRHVSGSTGQTELLIDHVESLRVPVPDRALQNSIVRQMNKARKEAGQLAGKADDLRSQSATLLAGARDEMTKALTRPSYT